MRAGIVVAAAACSVLSCSNATEPLASVSATLVGQTVSVGADGRLDATFHVAITNPTTRPIYYGGCAVALERQGADQSWESVWSPVCAAIAPASLIDGLTMIPAGASTDATVRILVNGTGGGWPSEGLEGSYRIRLAVLGPEPVIWHTMKNVQYKSRLLATNTFILAAD